MSNLQELIFCTAICVAKQQLEEQKMEQKTKRQCRRNFNTLWKGERSLMPNLFFVDNCLWLKSMGRKHKHLSWKEKIRTSLSQRLWVLTYQDLLFQPSWALLLCCCVDARLLLKDLPLPKILSTHHQNFGSKLLFQLPKVDLRCCLKVTCKYPWDFYSTNQGVVCKPSSHLWKC